MGLLDFFSKKPAPAPATPQPGGLLGQIPVGQNYRQYQEDMMMKGQTPMSLEDWQKAQQPPKK
jgi:hypothetical protein